MQPQKVNPKNFKHPQILFDNKKFSVAYGTWEDGKKYLAMRWNGDEKNVGFPKVFKHPMWFIIDNELKLPIIRTLIGISKTDKEKIINILKEELL